MTAIRSRRIARGVVAITTVGALMTAGQVAAWAAPFDTDPQRTWSANGRVNAIVRVGGTVFIGGQFTSLSAPNGATVARSYLAALDANTGVPLPGWVANANRPVQTLAVSPDGSRLFVGGAFSSVDGTRRVRLAALDVVSGDLLPWAPDARGTVRTLAVANGRVYLGGDFSSVNGSSRARLAAVDLASGELTPWSPTADNRVRDLAVTADGSRVVIAGDFDELSGSTRHYLGSVDAVSGSLDGWQPQPECVRSRNTCRLFEIVLDSSSVYAAVGGPGGRVTAWPLTSDARRWSVFADGDVQAVSLHRGLIYAGGHFYQRFGRDSSGEEIVRRRLAAVDTSGNVDSFNPHVTGDPGVWAIAATDDHLYIGGDFTSVSGVSQLRYAQFARAAEPGGDTSAPSVPGAPTAGEVTGQSVSLSWSASTDDTAVTGYQVHRDGVVVATVPGPSYTDDDLSPETSYVYAVSAFDAAGNTSDASPSTTVTTAPPDADPPPAPASSLVAAGSTWRYLDDGSDQGATWQQAGFDDSTWATGAAQLGHGDGDEVTILQSGHITYYFRTTFEVTDASAISGLTAQLIRDDGAVVYLNGVEVVRSNMPDGAIGFDTRSASTEWGSAERSWYPYTLDPALLNTGTNVLAVEVHNASPTSDISFDLSLEAS